MARDLRDILDEAAGTPPDLPDIEVIRRRARPALIRRRAAAGLAVVGLTLAAVAVTAELRDASPDRGTTVVHPVPSPAPRELRPGQLEPGTYVGRVGRYALRLTLPTDDWTVHGRSRHVAGAHLPPVRGPPAGLGKRRPGRLSGWAGHRGHTTRHRRLAREQRPDHRDGKQTGPGRRRAGYRGRDPGGPTAGPATRRMHDRPDAWCWHG